MAEQLYDLTPPKKIPAFLVEWGGLIADAIDRLNLLTKPKSSNYFNVGVTDGRWYIDFDASVQPTTVNLIVNGSIQTVQIIVVNNQT
jgi:hypothetical protein